MSAEKRWMPRDLGAGLTVAQAVAAADVEHHPRYQPEGSATWCNLFVWDVTRAVLGEAECAPHWIGPDNAPCAPFKGQEASANVLCAWLWLAGPKFGWRRADAAEAHAAAVAGACALATWANLGGHGHVAVVLPEADGIRIAQAGRTCFSNGSLARGFGNKPVTFYVHPAKV